MLALHDLNVAPPTLVPATSLIKRRVHVESPCELCAQPAGERHAHLFDVEERTLRCVCTGCRLALTANPTGRYREVPSVTRRVQIDTSHFGAPVGLFFMIRRQNGLILHYPGPAGITEHAISSDSCALELLPDVQALLVDEKAREQWLVGVDRCYELVERLRRNWQGITGGDEARAEVARFFEELAGEAAA
jgi:hypothetical protein